MGYYGDGPCEEYEHSMVPLKRAVVCSVTDCGAVIPAGSRASYTMSVFEGIRDAVWRCHRCERIYLHLQERCSAENATSWRYRALCVDDRLDCGIDYEEEWGEEPPPEIAALAFALPGEIT